MIAFFSNFLNDHQIPFCDSMYLQTNGKFVFVATEPISQERLDMKFEDANKLYSYVIRAYENDIEYQKALKIALEADVVIIGSAPRDFIVERIKQNKLTFKYSERFFKQGLWRILDPRVFIARYKQDIQYRNNNFHMLCASAYTASDCRFIFSYPKKTYKWGYFPQIKTYDIDSIIENKNKQEISILWVGRLIDLKHPEMTIALAKHLKNYGYNFSLTIIGEGILKPQIKKMVEKNNLHEYIKILDFMPQKEVRKYMEKSDVYLFTSDRNEGWGAVLNEAMNSGCAVVANKAIGSVPFLINDGENGLIYKDKKTFLAKVESLISNITLRKKLQYNAYQTMMEFWNAKVATKRLLTLIEKINSNKEIEFKDGPCSRA